MVEDLQNLLERIQREGVERAQADAEQIVGEAREKARQIVEEATQEAATTRAAGERGAQAFMDRAAVALEQTARDYLLRIVPLVQERIKRIYHRESVVIYPPVDLRRFSASRSDDGYFLVVSALVPYKRVDVAVEAFNSLGEKLLVIGGDAAHPAQHIALKNLEFRNTTWSEPSAPAFWACSVRWIASLVELAPVPASTLILPPANSTDRSMMRTCSS